VERGGNSACRTWFDNRQTHSLAEQYVVRSVAQVEKVESAVC